MALDYFSDFSTYFIDQNQQQQQQQFPGATLEEQRREFTDFIAMQNANFCRMLAEQRQQFTFLHREQVAEFDSFSEDQQVQFDDMLAAQQQQQQQQGQEYNYARELVLRPLIQPDLGRMNKDHNELEFKRAVSECESFLK